MKINLVLWLHHGSCSSVILWKIKIHQIYAYSKYQYSGPLAFMGVRDHSHSANSHKYLKPSLRKHITAYFITSKSDNTLIYNNMHRGNSFSGAAKAITPIILLISGLVFIIITSKHLAFKQNQSANRWLLMPLNVNVHCVTLPGLYCSCIYEDRKPNKMMMTDICMKSFI